MALFEFDRTSVITPHTHRGMLSAHLVARGALRARTYDRVSTEPDALVLRPAADRRLETGETSSIGPGRENVHWFVPLTEGAATFDVLVTGLDPGGPDYQLQPVDPLGGDRPGRRNAARAAPRLRGVGAPLRTELSRGATHSLQSLRYHGRGLFTSEPSGPIFWRMSCIDQPVSEARVSASFVRRSLSRSR